MSVLKRKEPSKPLADEDGEVRELTLVDMRPMTPVGEAMPELIEAPAEFRRKVGRPEVAEPRGIAFEIWPPLWPDFAFWVRWILPGRG